MRRLLVCLLGSLFLVLAGCNSGSKPISVTIVSPTGAQAIDIGQTFNISVQVNNDKLNKGAAFTMTGVGTLGNQTATAATYTAPTSGAGGNATITIASVSDPTKTITLNAVVTAAPSISNSSSTLAAAIQGVTYSASITVTGGAGTLTYSVSSGNLPAGLTLNSSTGAITGTPAGPNGTANFTVQVKDSSTAAPQTSSKAFSITVNQPPSITSANTTTFTVNTAGTFTVTTTASPTAAVSETGALPTGVTFVDNGNGTAMLAGTATATGTFPITITASNGIGTAASQNFTLIVGQAAAITSAAATTFAVGSAGNFSVTTTGYPAPSLTETGALPSGVTFVDNGNGTAKLSGTPTSGSGGTYPISIKAHNGVGSDATQNFTLTVNHAPVITSANSTSFPAGGAGTFTVTTSAFPVPAITETGALPTGVTFLDKGNGTAVISGTAAAPGTFPITITANNGIGTAATQSFTLTISTAPVFTSGNSTTFTVGTAGTFTVTATGSPTPTLTETNALPGGVTFVDNGNGTATLSGTPASGSGGSYSLTLKAHNGAGPDATQAFTLTVNQIPAITSANSTTFTVGMSGTSFTITTTGFPTTALAETGSLPSGVTFTDKGNGTATLSGTPAPGTAKSYPLSITANNGVAPNATQAFTLTVNPAAAIVISPATGALPNGTVGQTYNTTIGATGGVPPYTFTVDGGGTQLPSPLTLNSSTGVISGTPAATATLTGIIVDVTDSNVPATVQKVTYSLTISAAPTCVTKGSESLLNGQYAFVLKGFDNESTTQPVLVGGVLTFNGSGTITAGTIDINGNSTAGAQSGAITSGSYGVGSDHRGCMVVTTAAGTQNYRFSLGNISSGVASTGHVIDFDSTGPFTAGTMRKQNSAAFSTSQVTGTYVFGVSSLQNSASCNNSVCGGKFGAVGIFNFSSGNTTGGEVDFNNNGQLDGNSSNTTWPGSPVSISSGGAYTVSSTTGRGTLSFTPNVAGASAVNALIYVVSSTEVLVMSSDDQTKNSLFAGEMLQQSGAPFSASPLSGSFVGYDSGLGASSGRTDINLLGPLTSGSNSLPLTKHRNDSGTFTSQSGTGSYTLDSKGRLLVSGLGSHNDVVYLVNTSEAFTLNSNSGVDTGFFQTQSGGPFSGSSASGSYAFGNIDLQYANTNDNSGVAVFASPNVNVTEDDNGNGSQTTGGMQSFTYSVDSTGLGSIPSGCSVSATPTTCNTIFYIISPTKAVVMDTQSGSPKTQIADK